MNDSFSIESSDIEENKLSNFVSKKSLKVVRFGENQTIEEPVNDNVPKTKDQ